MAQVTVLILLPNSSHSLPSGTVMTLEGAKQQAASYYIARSNMQTLSWNLASTFDGIITIQATLNSDPQETDWANIYTIPSNTNKSGYENLLGNYTWLRAVVSNWTDGNINNVNVSY